MSIATTLFLPRDQPVHLYDAYTGAVRGTYAPYNGLDEMEAPNVVRFSNDGRIILAAGFRTDRVIHTFNADTPGRSTSMLRLGKTRHSSDGQKGLVSAVSFASVNNNSTNTLVAVGTYAPGSIYIYDLRAGLLPSGTVWNGICIAGHGKGRSRKKRRFVEKDIVLDNDNTEPINNSTSMKGVNDPNWFSNAKEVWFRSKTHGGVTQVEFAPTKEHILYSASRRSNCIISWDLRMLSDDPDYQSNPISGLGTFQTNNDTNQRIEFDLDSNGETIYVGSKDECLGIYNLSTGKLTDTIKGFGGVVNGVSHAYQQNGEFCLALATGSRTFPTEADFENEGCGYTTTVTSQSNLFLYKRKKSSNVCNNILEGSSYSS